MALEIEVKKLDVSINEVLTQLNRIGAMYLGCKKQRRYVYDIVPGDQSTWMRLRANGSKVTLSVKKIHHDGVDGTEEWEVEVVHFEETERLLRAMGFEPKAYQENRRYSYLVDGVEVEIDEWPKIPPYVEIEGPTPEAVYAVAAQFGWSKDDLTSINTTKVYKHYGIDLAEIAELKF